VPTAVYQDPVPSAGVAARVAALTNRPLASEYVWMDRRSYWFDEGASALRLVLERQGRGHQLPSADDYYACPCCLGVYPREAVAARALTIEDVPPKVLGGRPMLLTCGKCNSGSGTNFDAHAAQKAIADAFVRGDVTPKVRATSYIDGIPLRGTAQSTEDGISLVGVPKQNDPEVEAVYMRAMDSLAKEGGVSPRFSFTVHTRFDEARARLSLIRASYLAAFAGLGWSYILRSVMQPIRDQLSSPDAQLLETYIFRDPDSPNSTRRILLVDDPDELRCVAVMLGEYSVFLPAWWNPRTWDELAEAFCRRREPGDRLNLTLRGKEVPWPKGPMYLFDRPGKGVSPSQAFSPPTF
jgi:hypothetical protein